MVDRRRDTTNQAVYTLFGRHSTPTVDTSNNRCWRWLTTSTSGNNIPDSTLYSVYILAFAKALELMGFDDSKMDFLVFSFRTGQISLKPNKSHLPRQESEHRHGSPTIVRSAGLLSGLDRNGRCGFHYKILQMKLRLCYVMSNAGWTLLDGPFLWCDIWHWFGAARRKVCVKANQFQCETGFALNKYFIYIHETKSLNIWLWSESRFWIKAIPTGSVWTFGVVSCFVWKTQFPLRPSRCLKMFWDQISFSDVTDNKLH